MEAKVRHNDAGTLIITCMQFEIVNDFLLDGGTPISLCPTDLDALYAVLHARELCKTSDAYARRVEEAIKHAD